MALTEVPTSWLSPRRIIDMVFGAVVMGSVGVLIGLIMGHGALSVAGGLGIALGVVVGIFEGRRFLISILIGTLVGSALAWALAGPERISFGAGARSRNGWIFGCAALDALRYVGRTQTAGPSRGLAALTA